MGDNSDKKIWATYFVTRNSYMKFQNISIPGSKVMLCTRERDERTNARMNIQARSNIHPPSTFFKLGGIKGNTLLQSGGNCQNCLSTSENGSSLEANSFLTEWDLFLKGTGVQGRKHEVTKLVSLMINRCNFISRSIQSLKLACVNYIHTHNAEISKKINSSCPLWCYAVHLLWWKLLNSFRNQHLLFLASKVALHYLS